MASGYDLHQRWIQQTDGTFTLYEDTEGGNWLMSTAYRNVVNRLMDKRGMSQENLKMLQHLYKHDIGVVPTSNVASLSSFTGTMSYPQNIRAKFTYRTGFKDYECIRGNGKKNSLLEAATIRYPKYELTSTGQTLYYSTGTVTISGNSVTGIGTTFTSAMVGMEFFVGTTSYGVIATFVSATSITVTTASGNVTGSAYAIYTMSTDLIKIYPTSSTCLLITADYYTFPEDIDVTSVVDLNFDGNLNDMIVREAVSVAAAALRDETLYQNSLQEKANNA